MWTRADLITVVTTLRTQDNWDVWEAVEAPSFRPALAGSRPHKLWWYASQERGFDQQGRPLRPIALYWTGDWTKLQLRFAEHELTVQILGREPDAPPEARLLVITPQAREQDNDLRRLLRAFVKLRQQGIIALPRAGWTQSDGWSDVAGAQRHPRQTAVFWHAQSQEHTTETGMLASDLHLYWRGSAERIAGPLREEGLLVHLPANEDTAIRVERAADPPVLAALAEPPAPPAPADPLGLEGHPITQLWWSPRGHLLVATGFSQGPPASTPLLWLDPQGQPVAFAAGLSRHATCSAVVFLPDGRALSAWSDYEGASFFRVLEHTAPGPGVEILRAAQPNHTIALSAEGLLIGTPTGISARHIGPPNTPERPKPPGVLLRRATPRPPSAWQELHKRPFAEDSGLLVADCAPWVVAAGRGGRHVAVWRGDHLTHQLDLLPEHRGGHLVRGLVPLMGEQLGVLLACWQGGQPVYALQVWALSTGQKIEEHAGVTAITEHQGRRYLGTDQGAVDGQQVVQWGAVSALAVSAAGIAVGSDRGELRILPPPS